MLAGRPGATWGGNDVSCHHDLFARCTARNPSVGGNHEEFTERMDHRCSVIIYNREHCTCDGKPVSINVVNTTDMPGPATPPAVRRRVARIDDTRKGHVCDSRWHPDSDHDGMPDACERTRGLDPRDPSDGPLDPDGDGFTQHEDWLNNEAPLALVETHARGQH